MISRDFLPISIYNDFDDLDSHLIDESNPLIILILVIMIPRFDLQNTNVNTHQILVIRNHRPQNMRKSPKYLEDYVCQSIIKKMTCTG